MIGSYKGSLHTYVTTLFVTFDEKSSLDDKQVELGKFIHLDILFPQFIPKFPICQLSSPFLPQI
jgi:hypothetical protein